MTSPGKNLQADKRMILEQSDGKTFLAEEGIVKRIDDKRGGAYRIYKAQGTALFVIVDCIFEPVQRGGITIVEFRKGSDSGQSGYVDIAAAARFHQDFAFEAFDKTVGIDAVTGLRDLLATASKIHGD